MKNIKKEIINILMVTADDKKKPITKIKNEKDITSLNKCIYAYLVKRNYQKK